MGMRFAKYAAFFLAGGVLSTALCQLFPGNVDLAKGKSAYGKRADEPRSYKEIAFDQARAQAANFDRLTGSWKSVLQADAFSIEVDFRVASVSAKEKWKELDGSEFLLGQPQADFIHAGFTYYFVYGLDEASGGLTDVALYREPLGEDTENIEEIRLERREDAGE